MKRLISLVALALAMGATKASASISTSEKMVIMNMESGYFLGGGLDWGTHASDCVMPQWFTMSKTTTGGYYRLCTYQCSSSSYKSYLTSGGYMDGTEVALATSVRNTGNWTLSSVGDNAYTLENRSTSTYITGGTLNSSISLASSASANSGYWRILTQSEYEAYVADSASSESPTNATLYLGASNMSRRYLTSGYGGTDVWTTENISFASSMTTSYTYDDVTYQYYWIATGESYHTSEFSCQQTVELPVGIYKLAVQGFQRVDNSPASYTPSVLFAGDAETALPLSTSVTSATSTSSGSQTSAYIDFLARRYPCELEFVVTADTDGGSTGTVTLGIKGGDTNLWTCFGEWELWYYGNKVDKELSYEAYTNARMNVSIYEALVKAIEAFNYTKTIEDYQEALLALNAADASVAYYAQITETLSGIELDADGLKAWNASTSGKAYEAETLEDGTDVSADLLAAVKSQGTGSNMTYVLTTGEWICAQGNGPGSYASVYTETYSDGSTYNVFTAGDVMYQAHTGMPEGQYKVEFMAQVNSANSVSTTTADEGFEYYANETYGTGALILQSSMSDPTEYDRELTFLVDEDGAMKIGLRTIVDGGNWAVAKMLSLTYLGPYTYPELSAVEGTMNASVKSAMESALSTYTETNNQTNYNAAVAAIAAAEASVAYYQSVATALAELDLDEAGLAAFYNTTDGAAYKATTLADSTDLSSAYKTAVLAQTTPGKDVSLALDSLTWTCEQGNGPTAYSTGYETWSSSAYTSGAVMHQTIEGLVPEQTYQLVFYAAANATSTSIANGGQIAQAYANDQVLNVNVGVYSSSTMTSGAIDLHKRTITVAADADGQIVYGLQNVSAGGNWYVCEAVSLTVSSPEEEAENWTGDYAEGDTYTDDDQNQYRISGENLFVNGSFTQGVDGWKTVGYWADANPLLFTLSEDGGYDDGAYVETNGAGVASEYTLRQSVEVEPGKTYLFIAYTSGTAPTDNNKAYNALYKMTNAYTEVSDGQIVKLSWGDDGWTKTEALVTVPEDEDITHLGLRFGWNEKSRFDGVQIYEVEEWTTLSLYTDDDEMTDSVRTAANEAIAAYNNDHNDEALAKALAAIEEAQKSMAIYAKIAEDISIIDDLDEAGQLAWETYAEQYEAHTLATVDNPAHYLMAAVKAQIVAGSDLSYVMDNTPVSDGTLLIEGLQTAVYELGYYADGALVSLSFVCTDGTISVEVPADCDVFTPYSLILCEHIGEVDADLLPYISLYVATLSQAKAMLTADLSDEQSQALQAAIEANTLSQLSQQSIQTLTIAVENLKSAMDFDSSNVDDPTTDEPEGDEPEGDEEDEQTEEDTTTAIDGLSTQSAQQIYTLGGQKLGRPTKGLYIIDGRKVSVK